MENCVHSFQSAKFKNYEIILVDDGSKDGSDLLCDKLALMDNKVRVVHIEILGRALRVMLV
ncbi:MAG: glycosyltransferase [Christensenellales bacterium]